MIDPPGDGVYLVMCGFDREPVAECDDDELATVVALSHDQLHGCSPWVQYPLEHVHPGTEDQS